MTLMKSRYFTIKELVSPEILDVLTEECAWRLIPYSVIVGLDNLRRMYGAPIWINGKGLTQCGIRAKDCTTGAPKSRHKLYEYESTAFDLHCDDLDKLWDIVENNNFSLGIDKVEDREYTPSWLHVQFTSNLQVGILEVFKP